MENLEYLKKFWKNKRVFITGHTGFKGSWMSIMLNLLGAKIYGYALHPKKKSLFNEAKCKSFILKNFFSNINNVKILEKKINLAKPDVLFHLAAQPLVSESYINPLDTLNTNIIGTSNVLNSIRKNTSLKSVVIVTTDKVYKIKKSNKSYNENDSLGGKDPYSASKACAEIITKSYIESFFFNSALKNKISTARSGNVIGGGDYSKDRLLPDIIRSINSKKKLIIRNPNFVRPWQHVIEPLFGYLKLAEKQYKKSNLHKEPCWNFGPNKNNFNKVIDVVKIANKLSNLKIKVLKKQKFFETKILKLNNNKTKKNLKWHPKWNLRKSVNGVIEWNYQIKKNKSARQLCEEQIINYLN